MTETSPQKWLADRGIPVEEFERAGGSIQGARIVLPFTHRDGTPVERYVDTDKLNASWHNGRGSKVKGAVLVLGDLTSAERVAITEGPSDAIRSWMHLRKVPGWVVLAIPAAGQVPDDLADWIKDREVTVATDGDPAGDKAADAAVAKLNGNVVRRYRPAEGTDLRDLADKLGPGAFARELRRAPELPKPAANDTTPDTCPGLPPAFERFLGALTARDLGPRDMGGGQWAARCPAHHDHNPSLTFAVGNDVPVVVTCQAGCETEAVAAALGMQVRDFTVNEQAPVAEFRIVTADEFASADEPGGRALIGEDGNALVVEGSDVMWYGDGGAGKTTLEIDCACHLAAGDDFLGVRVPRPLRVLVIENEGPRKPFRQKIERKIAAWPGSPLDGRLTFLEEPWAEFTFGDAAHRDWLAQAVRESEFDVVIVGPLAASGMEEAGTLQDVRKFAALLKEVRRASGRLVSFWIIHHDSKAGKVSGAWEGVGDTLLKVASPAPGHTTVFVQKARWGTGYHLRTFNLGWFGVEGFVVQAEGVKLKLSDTTEADAEKGLEVLPAGEAEAISGLEFRRRAKDTFGWGEKRADAALKRLVRDGLVQAKKGARRAVLHWQTVSVVQ